MWVSNEVHDVYIFLILNYYTMIYKILKLSILKDFRWRTYIKYLAEYYS